MKYLNSFRSSSTELEAMSSGWHRDTTDRFQSPPSCDDLWKTRPADISISISAAVVVQINSKNPYGLSPRTSDARMYVYPVAVGVISIYDIRTHALTSSNCGRHPLYLVDQYTSRGRPRTCRRFARTYIRIHTKCQSRKGTVNTWLSASAILQWIVRKYKRYLSHSTKYVCNENGTRRGLYTSFNIRSLHTFVTRKRPNAKCTNPWVDNLL